MRLPTLAVLAPLVGLAAADKLVTTVICMAGVQCSYINGWWTTGYGSYWATGTDGCHWADMTTVPSLENWCLDFANNRGHFYFYGQGKRCLRVVSFTQTSYSPSETQFAMVWEEVTCTW
ncbi:hypothetical protein C8A05DRAFT_19109 [Staphylotrichum tortipilum]|uniref:Uncharacterized protein n=1 Tax=Staphylotrichum tortipilum TaxID=2831512 RepID=A0AAN6MCB8_9PEZI|nr:hypothetical protein C8A05DRAFT_19109 [Staphylotrichum longicolle]